MQPSSTGWPDQLHFDSDRFAKATSCGSLSGEALKAQLLHELCRPHELL